MKPMADPPVDPEVTPDGDTSEMTDHLVEASWAVLDAHWRPEGFTVPNAGVYPWQWLWDSCFHAVCWAALDDDRAAVELERTLAHQSGSGFVPHMTYWSDPGFAAGFWGRATTSCITQPPMFGHAVVELAARGHEVSEGVIDRAVRGVRFLLDGRRRHADSGLVLLCHPWESGADDSPRFDDACPGGWTLEAWYRHKGALVDTIVFDATGGAVANPAFEVASVGFNALLAFNALELAGHTGDVALRAAALELGEAVAARWDPELGTWVDGGATAAGSGRVRTLDGLLALLVDPAPERLEAVAAELVDPGAHGGACGPSGVHRGEEVFEPRTYWRGPAWPQLSYLLWVALCRAAHPAAAELVGATIRGAVRSGLAEYWDADDGTGLGAIPQSWAALAAVMALSRPT